MNIVLCLLLNSVLIAQHNSLDTAQCETNCQCETDLSPVGNKFSHVHQKHEWMVSYQWMNMSMMGLKNQNHSLSDASVLQSYSSVPTLMPMNMHMLMAMYGISDRLTIMFMLGYNSIYMEMKMPMGKKYHTHGMSTSGFNDSQLHLLYSLYKKHNQQFFLNAGFSVPTGRTNIKGEVGSMMYSNEIYPYCMQMGTGTFDIYSGINHQFQINNIAVGSNVSSIIRPYYNTYGYKWGNEIQVGTWLGWQWSKCLSSSVRIDLSNQGVIKLKHQPVKNYEDITASPSNYGGKKLNIYFGSTLKLRKEFLKNYRVRFEYGIPLYQNLNGLQMSVKKIMYADLTFNF